MVTQLGSSSLSKLWGCRFFLIYNKTQKCSEIASFCAQLASADPAFTRRFDGKWVFKMENVC